MPVDAIEVEKGLHFLEYLPRGHEILPLVE